MAPGDTEEPGDSRITTTIALCGRKHAGGAKKKKSLYTLHSRDAPPPPTFVTKAYASPQAHMHSQSRPQSPHPTPPPRSHSCLIKSISCASAVPRQTTFKQASLLGGEQMRVGTEFI